MCAALVWAGQATPARRRRRRQASGLSGPPSVAKPSRSAASSSRRSKAANVTTRGPATGPGRARALRRPRRAARRPCLAGRARPRVVPPRARPRAPRCARPACVRARTSHSSSRPSAWPSSRSRRASAEQASGKVMTLDVASDASSNQAPRQVGPVFIDDELHEGAGVEVDDHSLGRHPVRRQWGPRSSRTMSDTSGPSFLGRSIRDDHVSPAPLGLAGSRPCPRARPSPGPEARARPPPCPGP